MSGTGLSLVALGDDDSSVRDQAVDLLGRTRTTDIQAYRAVEAAAETDPHEGVRATAAAAARKLWFAIQAKKVSEGARQAADPEPSPSAPVASWGTCLAVRPDGVILTADHVIDGAEDLTIQWADGRLLAGRVTKRARWIDAAAVQVGAPTPAYLPLAGTSSLSTGLRVFTIGFQDPARLGSEPKYTEGVISSLSGLYGDAIWLQTTVPIQPGNSGGPLVNENGEVVGTMVAKAAAAHFFEKTGSLPENVN